jgi:hypothetical protein
MTLDGLPEHGLDQDRRIIIRRFFRPEMDLNRIFGIPADEVFRRNNLVSG